MTAIVIRDYSGAEVHRIDTTELSESQKERAYMGVVAKTDLDRYTVGEESEDA